MSLSISYFNLNSYYNLFFFYLFDRLILVLRYTIEYIQTNIAISFSRILAIKEISFQVPRIITIHYLQSIGPNAWKINHKNHIHWLIIEPYLPSRYLRPPTRIILLHHTPVKLPNRARNEGTPGDVIVWKSFYINTGLSRLTPFSIQHSSGRDWPRFEAQRARERERHRERGATTGGWPGRVELSCSGIFMSAERAGFEPIYIPASVPPWFLCIQPCATHQRAPLPLQIHVRGAV